jgi:hypothetical protein
VQRGGEVEAGALVREHAGHVGGEVHDVRQVQHERRLGHVRRRAVRPERLRHRPHRVLVLLQVLAGAGQSRGESEVAGVVAAAADRAGEHARGDEALLAAHEHLGGGPTSPSTLKVQQPG